MAGAEVQRSGARFGEVALGAGSMLGAGAFTGWSPAAASAGWWSLPAVAVAVATAAVCAMSVAAQASSCPGADPAQACVRERMGPVPGRISASTRAIGMVVAMGAVARSAADHLAPNAAQLLAPVAVLAVVLVATAGLRIGATARGWLLLTVVVVGVVVATCFGIAPEAPATPSGVGGFTGTTGAAGALFFAFLGFEHLAASGRHSRRALIASFAVAAGGVLLLGCALLAQLGPERLALSPQPSLDALGAAAAGALRSPVGAGIAIALVPVLFRTLEAAREPVLAAAEARELPAALVRRGGSGTPYLLDLALGALAAVVSALVPAGQAITVAAGCALVHYAFANGSARLLLADRAAWPSRLACGGMILSVVLVMSLPVPSMLATLAAVVLGPLLLTAGSRSRRPS